MLIEQDELVKKFNISKKKFKRAIYGKVKYELINNKRFYPYEEIIEIIKTLPPKNIFIPKENLFISTIRKTEKPIIKSKIEDLTRTERCQITQYTQIKNKNLYEQYFNKILSTKDIFFFYQYIISPYIVDFYIPSKGLIIEIDGAIHNEKFAEINDAYREEYLTSFGLILMRYNTIKSHQSPEEFINETLNIFPILSKSRRQRIKRRISRMNIILGNPNFKIEKIKNYKQIELKYRGYQSRRINSSELRRQIRKLGKEKGTKKFFAIKRKFLDKKLTYRMPAINTLSIKQNEYGVTTN